MRRAANGEGSVSKRRDGRYEGAAYVLTTAGIRRRVRVYAATRLEARRKLSAVLTRAEAGIPTPDRAWRLGAYLDYWLEDVIRPTRRARTYELYESLVRRLIKPALAGRLLTRLNVADVQIFLNRSQAAGCTVRTVQQLRNVLSGALSRAQREELVSRNVARLVEIPAWHRKDIHPWTPEQLAIFLRVSQGHPYYAAFVLIGLYGLRRGEAAGLRWADIDFDLGIIHIRQQLQRIGGALELGPVKTASGRRDLPLLPLVRSVLLTIPEPTRAPERLVLQTTSGAAVEPGNLLRAFHHICREHKLPPITLHHLRHTTATLLKNIGVPARDAQLILGHAHISTTQQLYQHQDVAGQLAALSRLEQLLMTTTPVFVRSRQDQPSNWISKQYSQRMLSGGPAGTRTPDTLLKRLSRDAELNGLTDVKVLAQSRYRSLVLGWAAVTLSRQAL